MSLIQFNGKITTVSPVSISTPGVNGLLRDSRGNPMISGSSIRGWLRHSGHQALTHLKADEQQFFTVDEHYMLASGVDTARVVQDDESIGAVLKVREQNPFLSIFGRWKFAGHLSVGNAVATARDIVKLGGGARSHVFKRSQEMSQFIAADELVYLADILAADGDTSEATKDLKKEEKALLSERRTADADRKKEINKRLEDIEKQVREVKDERTGASETIQRPLDAFEAIDAGVVMPHRMNLTNPSEDEYMTTLFVLLAASKKPLIGGHRNLGCGHIEAEWELTKLDLRQPPQTLGRVIIKSAGIEFDIPGVDETSLLDYGRKLANSTGLRHFG